MGMRLEISTEAQAAILTHAASSADEVCGLLFGTEARIEAVRACANVHADPARFFELDPAALLAAHRAQRSGGPRIVGHYHSHPHGHAEPSPRDAADAAPDGAVWIIAAGGRLAAYRAVAKGVLHGRFDPVVLETCVASGARPKA